MGGSCHRSWQIDPLREGRLGPRDSQSFERHRRVCPECAALCARDGKLRELGRSLRSTEPTELVLRRLRARVLRDAAVGRPPSASIPRWTYGAFAFALVASAIIASIVVVRRHPAPTVRAPSVVIPVATAAMEAPDETFAGSVLPSPDARWTRSRRAGVERVQLSDGILVVHVRPQLSGERFLIDLPDGELEVRGTTFEVVVHRAATVRVHVVEGTVELRLAGRPVRAITANETWDAPASPLPVSAAVAAPPRVVMADEVGTEYAAAMRLLRDGKDEAAAAAFHAFAASRARASQAEDASFLEAVALARAGRVDAAALAAERHLESFPGSFHRSEAAILVARAASARGDCPKVRSVLSTSGGAAPEGEAKAVLRECGVER